MKVNDEYTCKSKKEKDLLKPVEKQTNEINKIELDEKDYLLIEILEKLNLTLTRLSIR